MAATATRLGQTTVSTPALADAGPAFFVQRIAATSTLTRAQVVAETGNARGHPAGPHCAWRAERVFLTALPLELVRMAGLRALRMNLARR